MFGIKCIIVWELPYYFENCNTVRYYDNIAGYPHWGAVPTYSTALPSPMNGYYAQALFEYTTYTYKIIDNKLYIPLQGVIITISGNNLVQDGGLTFTKK